jgi:ethanolamine utilization protein EutQ (cupin superfamily)
MISSTTTNELVTVMVGKLRLTIGGEEIVAEPGDEVFIPKETPPFSQEYRLLYDALAVWV